MNEFMEWNVTSFKKSSVDFACGREGEAQSLFPKTSTMESFTTIVHGLSR